MASKNKVFTLKLNLSGPPGTPITTLQQTQALLSDPHVGWVLTFGGIDHKIQHVRQNLDTGALELWLGAIWEVPEHYQARLEELKQQGWEEVTGG